jgi:hypothetical protein
MVLPPDNVAITSSDASLVKSFRPSFHICRAEQAQRDHTTHSVSHFAGGHLTAQIRFHIKPGEAKQISCIGVAEVNFMLGKYEGLNACAQAERTFGLRFAVVLYTLTGVFFGYSLVTGKPKSYGHCIAPVA